MRDGYQTTIEYLKLKPEHGRYFTEVLVTKLLSHPEYPDLASEAKKKIYESILEIFDNAKHHSETMQIYTCGQYFPQKNSIKYTITDTGIGIPERIFKTYGRKLDSRRAIEWAIEYANSTKQNASGGIGLYDLKDFIAKNQGRIHIVSADGFYELDPSGERFLLFDKPFPGTIVNMEFCTKSAPVSAEYEV